MDPTTFPGRAAAPAGQTAAGSSPVRSSPAAGSDALARTERHLRLVGRGPGQAALARWRISCPDLAAAPIDTAAELPAWLRSQPASTANRVLGSLVAAAQDGDHLAVVAVLACLAPGIRGLARHAGLGVDETLSEVAVGLLDFPVERRTSVAGGLLLDARNRLSRARQRAGRAQPVDLTDGAVQVVAPGELGHPIPPAQRLVQIVGQAHRQGLVDRTEARLILDTRLGGHRVRPLARRLGLTASAAYQRRSRAEARLAAAV
jgi:hypothetical protein